MTPFAMTMTGAVAVLVTFAITVAMAVSVFVMMTMRMLVARVVFVLVFVTMAFTLTPMFFAFFVLSEIPGALDNPRRMFQATALVSALAFVLPLAFVRRRRLVPGM
jgi:hypothetical protein